MRAVVLDQFGSADHLHLRDDVDKPSPRRGEVLVHVHATSVNPLDTKVRKQGGRYGVEPPAILGYDVSGVVEAVGEDVDSLVEGDAVFYTAAINAHGAYAEYHVAEAGDVVVKPDNVEHEEAAAIPLAACTAYQALVDRARVQVGETVLIHGGGGVGHFAVQIAEAAGARVVVVGNGAMEDTLLDLGADVFVDYKRGGAVSAVLDLTDGLGADVVFDTVGGTTLVDSIDALAPLGRMVSIVGDATGDFGKAYQKNAAFFPMMMKRDGGMMDLVAGLVERGLVAPLVADVLPLADAAEAHRRVEAGGVHGKLVLTP
ncbi:zinc-binding dehydrogenase [Rubrivirga sp. S365]|uniref:Zinc-binding dehydrogenase n=1 Tax=Rubrivirga litoralis TaxID=3075598 RepID=A0ABU3BQW6_9BACT|nr:MULTISPECIES: zinc-binding dehydrogenase [unclassified Rubrivirga]MDT0631681.1 zinc-binding dehydrogenase [Rubrivirga sp. F394]MDT7855576.1 zinc-binding dehydrogenase [Rubrivirga sp. S365]